MLWETRVSLRGGSFRRKLGDPFSLGIHHLLLLHGQRERLPCQAFRSRVPPPPLPICSGLLLQHLQCRGGTGQCHRIQGLPCPGIPQLPRPSQGDHPSHARAPPTPPGNPFFPPAGPTPGTQLWEGIPHRRGRGSKVGDKGDVCQSQGCLRQSRVSQGVRMRAGSLSQRLGWLAGWAGP